MTPARKQSKTASTSSTQWRALRAFTYLEKDGSEVGVDAGEIVGSLPASVTKTLLTEWDTPVIEAVKA